MMNSTPPLPQRRRLFPLLAASVAGLALVPGGLRSQEVGDSRPALEIVWPGRLPSNEVPTPSPVSGRPGNKVAPHVRTPLSDAVRDVAAANNSFGFDLFAQLRSGRDGDENLLVSPLSVSTALAMTSAGARGRNAQQMAATLHLDQAGDGAYAGYGSLQADFNVPREGYQLSIANKLFGQEGAEFRDSFINRLANDFQAPLERLDFYNSPEPSRVHINEWVSDQTNQRIKDLLPEGSVTCDTSLVLTNAVYFDGQWKHQFNKEATRDAPFYAAASSTQSTPTMYQRNVLKYGQFADFQMLEMPYAGDDLSMVVLLPNERDGLAALEQSLSRNMFDESIEALKNREVDVYLPKFTFEDKAKLKAPLQSLGMIDAFDGGDFSGISEASSQIDEVYHQTFIDVNESGTEAAAATAVVMIWVTAASWTPPPPPVFRADHPFLFALRDTHSGSLLFLGRMADPNGATAAASVPEPGTGCMALAAMIALAASTRAGRRT